MPAMPADSYLRRRQSERRWRVVTALVVAGAMAAGAVWTLSRHDAPHGAPSPTVSHTQTAELSPQNRK